MFISVRSIQNKGRQETTAEIKDGDTNEEGRLNDPINNESVETQSSLDLEVDEQESHDN